MADDLFDKVVLLTECTTEMGQTTALGKVVVGVAVVAIASHIMLSLLFADRMYNRYGTDHSSR